MGACLGRVVVVVERIAGSFGTLLCRQYTTIHTRQLPEVRLVLIF